MAPSAMSTGNRRAPRACAAAVRAAALTAPRRAKAAARSSFLESVDDVDGMRIYRPPPAVTKARLKLIRTGIDDLPEIHAVLDLLHLGGETAVAADPLLHRLRVIRHQIRGALVARHL